MHLPKDPRILPESTLTILGGAGGMGRPLTLLFKPSRAKIQICSRDLGRARKAAEKMAVSYCAWEEAPRSDILIVSVPTSEVAQVCLQVLREMNEGSLLIEIASVKTGITDMILEHVPQGVEYLSLHPLFGPRTRAFRGENVLFIPARPGPRSEAVLEHLKRMGANTTRVEVKEHDRLMAVVQAMHHYGLLSLGVALMSNLNPNIDHRFYTTLLRKSIRHLATLGGNLRAVIDIQRLNPYAKSARERFIESAQAFRDLDSNNMMEIEDCFKRLRRLLSEKDKSVARDLAG